MTHPKTTPYDYTNKHSNHQQQQNAREFVLPQHPDVLCGRGKDCFEHYGNIHFRQLIQVMLPQYVESNSKKNKMRIIRTVVDKILQQGGRFLKKDVRHDQWYDGGIVCGKDKVGHSFRDAKVQARKCNNNNNKNNTKSLNVMLTQEEVSSEENRGAVALTAFKMGNNNHNHLVGSGNRSGQKSITDKTFMNHDLRSIPSKVMSSTEPSTTSSLSSYITTKSVTYDPLPETPYSMNNAKTMLENRTASQMDDVHAASSLLFLQRASTEIKQPCAVSVPKKSDEANKTFYFI